MADETAGATELPGRGGFGQRQATDYNRFGGDPIPVAGTAAAEAAPADDLESKTKEELGVLINERGIAIAGTATKAEMIAALREAPRS